MTLLTTKDAFGILHMKSFNAPLGLRTKKTLSCLNALTPVQETVKKTIGNVTIVASLLTKHATINACQNLCTDVGTVAFFKTKHATEPVLGSLKSTVMVVVLTIEFIMYGSVKAAVYLKM